MNQLERVEKIREKKTGVTYEGGKKKHWRLQAEMYWTLSYIWKIRGRSRDRKNKFIRQSLSRTQSMELIEAAKTYETEDHESFGDIVKKFLKWCGRMIKKGCENFLSWQSIMRRSCRCRSSS